MNLHGFLGLHACGLAESIGVSMCACLCECCRGQCSGAEHGLPQDHMGAVCPTNPDILASGAAMGVPLRHANLKISYPVYTYDSEEQDEHELGGGEADPWKGWPRPDDDTKLTTPDGTPPATYPAYSDAAGAYGQGARQSAGAEPPVSDGGTTTQAPPTAPAVEGEGTATDDHESDQAGSDERSDRHEPTAEAPTGRQETTATGQEASPGSQPPTTPPVQQVITQSGTIDNRPPAKPLTPAQQRKAAAEAAKGAVHVAE